MSLLNRFKFSTKLLTAFVLCALITLLILVLVRPLAPMRGEASGTHSPWSHPLAGLSAAVLILGCGLSLAARHAEPASAVDVVAE